MIATIIILLVVLFVIEVVYNPRLKWTNEGNLLLWVNGKYKREWTKIF